MYNTRKEIENWLNEIEIEDYVINEDLTVDVNEDVNIHEMSIKEIPIRFGRVNGNFNCNSNLLINLKNCPNVVNGSFYCANNQLTSLEGCLEVISGDFNCGGNKLTNFEYFPKEIRGNHVQIIYNNEIKEEELVNFNCNIENVKKIYSDFNKNGSKEEFLNKVNYYKIKKENELLKELSIHSNNVKLNKKL